MFLYIGVLHLLKKQKRGIDMKKIIAVLLALILLLIPMSLTASATAINADEQRIIDCLSQKATINDVEFNIPKNYVTQAENYLKTVDVTTEQADEIIAYLEQAIEIIKDSHIKSTTDLDVLSYADKKEILDCGKKAALVVGAVLVYDGDHIVITNEAGEIVFNDDPIVKTTGANVDFTSIAVSAGVVVLLLAASFVVARKKGLFVK